MSQKKRRYQTSPDSYRAPEVYRMKPSYTNWRIQLLTVAIAAVSFSDAFSTTPTINTRSSVRFLPLFAAGEDGSNDNVGGKAHPLRSDIDVIFGSDAISLEDDEGDEEESFDKEQRKRRETIAKILKEQDEEFKKKRKKEMYGEYANAKSLEEISEVEEQERQKIARANSQKAELAKEVGVTLEMLGPKEETIFEEDGNIKITAGSGIGTGAFYEEMDQDLKQEWEELGARDSDTQVVNGKVVSRDAMQGVRVGSAGGWTLEIFPGDFVVHRKYGIGRFERTCLRPKSKLTPEEQQAQQLRRKEILTAELRKKSGGLTPDEIQSIRNKFGTEEDTDPISNPQSTVLEIAYSDALVHVPVDRAYRLSRYRAGDAVVKPRLSKVKGEAWAKAKSKVEENTLQLAQDVLALYATRETLQRQPFDPTVEPEVETFSKTFGFTPTPDQKTCFEDVENDMVWRSRPMDRLVCGDVGFGKTEVALRAIFRAVANGRQAALLAPTGVLAAQHFKNVVKRMGPDSGFNFNAALLRGGMGKNTKAGREMRERIKSGEINLIVGTHAILSNDLQFNNLGLLVVDEEQRFGVKQKERLKLICGGIDVLTLSATPIPRTLQMSLSGIRDTSTIRSPPPMRKPTITYVQDFSEELVLEAISRELDRGGQVFYVVPRISMLEEAAETIKRLFPGIGIIQAHGRMARGVCEENVSQFAEGKHEVLLATTVIENGVDIPSVNTIIIQNSQSFGMATLYQLRGRVGRSDKQAFAYFLHREEAVTEQAAMRLQAIGELNELGSGFDVANRDLEIRGAGSLLGTEQSGMAAKVGFDLYMRMLKKSIRQLRGLDLPVLPRTNILLPNEEGSIEVSGKSGVSRIFSIPKTYITDEDERRKQETAARLAESTARLVELTNLWKKTFGPLPASLQTKLKTMHLHACTRRLGIDLVGLQDRGDGTLDCLLRSPGLRPRHLGMICPNLPRGVPTKGLNICFPARFTPSGDEQVVVGGKKIDTTSLLPEDGSAAFEDEEWDALDQEEVEAMKEISSSLNVTSLDQVDMEQYPHFVVPDFGSIPEGQRVDALLKVLLPSAKVVYGIQETDKENAKVAAELREKRELLKQKQKEQESAPYQTSG